MNKDRFSGDCIRAILGKVPVKHHRDIFSECLSDVMRHVEGGAMLTFEDWRVLKELMGYDSPKITTVGDKLGHSV